MIGTILGDRYEIIEEIGNGGMAVVYKAKCKLLNRFVAVKVLRKEFVNDEEFLARFKVESQAAASLSHPNIVSIYDVGTDNGISYIVMEYVDGITLKEYISINGMLAWREACEFAIQILSALEHAHKNGIVHRDIKPHNIIVTPDKILKVTDFGIARAASSATMTISGNTIGSVHYFSPEQARGSYTDAKSDLYSVGIVLYEMLASRLPFDGESPIAIAIMQIQNSPPPLKDFNVSIPLALDKIVTKSIKKEQSARYQSATEMISDLKAVVQQPNISLDTESLDNGATKKMKAVVPNDIQRENDREQDEQISILDEEPTPYQPRSRRAQEKTNPIPPAKEQIEEKKKSTAAIAAGIIVSLLIVSVTGYSIWAMFFSQHSPTIEVPSVVGLRYGDVVEKYKDDKFDIIISQRVNDPAVEKDYIISQDPGAGSTYKRDRVQIQVVVSDGVKTFVLENYKGKEEREATMKLEQSGLKVTVVKKDDNNMATGYIIDTLPVAGSTVKTGTEITLYVSKGGGGMTKVPLLVGKKIEDAKRTLQENGLTVGTIDYQESNQPSGTVLIQSVSEGNEVEMFTQIDMLVSDGKNATPSPTPTSSTEPSQRTKNLTIQVPQSKDSTLIKVVADGKIIHEERHYKEEVTFTVPLTGKGKINVEIFYDNVSQGILEQTL